VRFVEQEEARIARQRHRDCEASSLPHRQAAVHDVGLAREPESFERGVGVADVSCGRTRGEAKVLADGEVVVAERLVPDESEVTTRARAVVGEIVVEDDGLPGVEGHQAREQPQQRGLARAVGAGEQDDLSGRRIEIDSGESRETPQETDGGAATDDGRHSRLREFGPAESTERGRRRSNRRPSAAHRDG
jgi:hypothetical protein